MNSELLQTNPFFSALLDHIPKLASNCVKKEWVLAVPQLVSLPEPHKLGLELLKSHVLVPTSPNEFTTLSGLHVTRLNEKELKVHPQVGTPSRVVTILFREIVYSGLNGDQGYTLLCLSRPLVGSGHVPLLDNGREVFDESRSAEEWKPLLFNTPRMLEALAVLEHRVAAIKDPCLEQGGDLKSYVMMRKQAVSWANSKAEEEEDALFHSAKVNARYKLILQTAFESCIALECHAVLFASLSTMHQEAENDLQVRLHQLRYSALELREGNAKTGLTVAFLERFPNVESNEQFQSCVEHLQRLNLAHTPLDKLVQLKLAAHALKRMEANVNMDDALPLFLLALLHAAPGLLLANLAYMTDFAPRAWLKANGELAFHCTVFQGAVSLVQGHSVAHLTNGDEGGDDELLRNLVVAGGSGLGVSWKGGSAGTDRPRAPAAASPPPASSPFDPLFAWLCAPSTRAM